MIWNITYEITYFSIVPSKVNILYFACEYCEQYLLNLTEYCEQYLLNLTEYSHSWYLTEQVNVLAGRTVGLPSEAGILPLPSCL